MSLPLITGVSLPPLGWQHVARLLLDVIQPVANDTFKPKGGLWTSPLRPEGGTGWTEWCAGENWGTPHAPITVVIPDPGARVYVIDTVPDLAALEAAYRDPRPALPVTTSWPSIDWVGVSRDIDAVWLTDEGQWRTRFSTPSLYGWDCETVFWLNPRLHVGDLLEHIVVDGVEDLAEDDPDDPDGEPLYPTCFRDSSEIRERSHAPDRSNTGRPS